jgi:hypothetical protein
MTDKSNPPKLTHATGAPVADNLNTMTAGARGPEIINETHGRIVRLWVERLEWLGGLSDPDPPLESIAHTKLRQFAAEAAAMEVSDLLDIAQPGRRHTLVLALLRQSRMRCRDELIEMMLRRIRRTQAAAKEQLDALHDQHRGIEETLIGIFGQVLETEQAQDTDATFGRQVRKLLLEQGGVAALAEQCETVSAWHRGNDLPLLWPIHTKHRVQLFRLLDLVDVRSATQERSLLDALGVVRKHRHARRDEVLDDVDLGFASQRWQSFVAKRRFKPGAFDRRALKVCVFVHLAGALQTGDLYVVGAETFANYRAQLLPWAECEARLPAYRAALGIPEQGEDFAAALKAELTTLAAAVDAGFPTNSELSVDADGTPHLKQLVTTEQPAGLAEFEQEIRTRMPERHLLDILKHAEHWSRYTRHFGPPSGSDPKLAHAVHATCSPCLAMAAISAQAKPPSTHPSSGRRRRCAGSTLNTSMPTSWRPRWSMLSTSTPASLCPGIGAAAAPRSPTART